MPPLIGSIGGISEYAYRGTLDDYPDEFLFNNITNAEPGVNYTSGITTITGINYKTKVSVGAGGSFSVNGDAFSTAPRFLRSGDELELSLTTVKDNLTTDFSRENNLVVFVGKRETIWSVTTRDINNNLVPVGFTSVTNHLVGSSINSNTVNISGLETGYSTPVSVIGFNASISINGGSLVTSGTVSNGDNFYVNLPALSTTEQESYGRTRTTSITVGTYTTTWTVITESPDLTPDAFSFTNVTNAQINTTYTSNSITVSGINGVTIPKFSIPISISGSGFEYNINGGAFTSQPGLVVSGDVIALRTTPISYATTSTGTLTINGVSSSWSVTTGSQPFDTVPDPFSFSSLTNTPQNTTFTSNEITLSGMTAGFPATATISGTGEFRVVRNGTVIRDYSSSSTNVQLGDKITLRNTSSSSYSTTKTTTFIVSGTNLIGEPGTTSASWNITTEAPPIPPTITLNASSTSVIQGNSVTLTWSSTDATSVSSSNFGATTVNGSLVVTPSVTTTYNITVSGPGGSVSASITVNVSASAPTITLNASPITITQGSSATLTWSSSNATSVTSSNFGATTVNGSTTVSPSSTTPYNITVSGPGGSTTATVTVTVLPPPTITLNASQTTIAQGESTTLTWSSTDATSVTSSNFGATTVNGSTTVSPSVTTTYNITVSGPGGSVSATVNISVSPPPTPPPTVSLFALQAGVLPINPLGSSISKGSSATLTWSSTNATGVSSSNFGATTVSGSTTVTPSSSTTYTITVSGPGGSATATRTISVYCIPIEGRYGYFGASGFTGYLLYGNGFKDSNLQFITNPLASFDTVIISAGGITTTYSYIGEVVINHYVNNFARYPEQDGYDYWVLDFINNPSYTNFTIFTNAITTAYNEPGGERDLRASRGGLVGNYDSCDVKRL